MNDQLSKICPECRGYILGDQRNCPYCGFYLKGKRKKLGFYSILFIIFAVLMIMAILIKGSPNPSLRKIQPYIKQEKIKHI